MTTKENEAQVNHDNRMKLKKLLEDAVKSGMDLECTGEDIMAELSRIQWAFNAFMAKKATEIYDSREKEDK